ncbi:SBP (S-ribonuclease binding protein) family protein [Abeliophyllum distichum]|uniref:SBP (S-ribonuclease binding protein) family protein n=1 Tax=Abeliophyllum distichum TaxID=126358 RepID=A0ABD1U0R9_9LAMI
MAVQAQYPSIVLHICEGNNPPGNDYPLQPGEFLDPTNSLFNQAAGNVGTNNLRKRGREFENPPPMSIQLQSETQGKRIDFTQFNTTQTTDLKVVSTGLRLASGEQNQLQQPPHRHQAVSRKSAPSSIFTQDVAHQFKQQLSEFDSFLQTQGEELRRALARKNSEALPSAAGGGGGIGGAKAERERD